MSKRKRAQKGMLKHACRRARGRGRALGAGSRRELKRACVPARAQYGKVEEATVIMERDDPGI